MPSPYGHDWQKLRARFLHHHPTCRICGEPAKHVDHIVTVKRAPERRLDWTNLQALCASHHNRLTQAFDNPNIVTGCDAQGKPFDRQHPWASGGLGVGRQSKQDWVREAIAEMRYPWLHRETGDG